MQIFNLSVEKQKYVLIKFGISKFTDDLSIAEASMDEARRWLTII